MTWKWKVERSRSLESTPGAAALAGAVECYDASNWNRRSQGRIARCDDGAKNRPALEMSEELLQTKPFSIGRYTYHRLGASTISQIVQAGLIQGPVPASIRNNKPDGLIVLGKGATKAWIEYKTPAQLNTKRKLTRAINQSIDPAKSLCNLLVVSDGQKTYWINPHTRNELRSNYKLPVFDAKRIVDGSATEEYLQILERIIDQSDHSISSECDELRDPTVIDPSDLAQTVWQKIWINTGKAPEKCLYNVVELFVFKFLSDLAVLKPNESFENVCAIGTTHGYADALNHYAQISRPAIRSLFPEGDDGTGIINGTIFIDDRGSANEAEAGLFWEVLTELRKYDKKHGSFKYIDKQFKTRLYESFLRQGAGLHHLGQFFTPRNVVQAIVGMSGANTLPSGASVCDPFCGVGGFLLETILQNPRLTFSFNPENGVIEPDIKFIGYDRGSDEKEDERTIILAKANAVIYFSDMLARHNTAGFTSEFADKVINPMFKLLRTNLGTFEIDDSSCYDLILTNPPYVTRGSRSLKDAINESGFGDRYNASGRGTESLALQWIIRSLKPGGTAITIVPDGLLNQNSMLEFIKKRCIVRAILSLPVRTFYATPKKTYILAITRKQLNEEKQTDPVFSYLVSETGETRDANRWPIDANDLPEMVGLYNQFKGSPGTFVPNAPRNKIVDWTKFDLLEHWMLDRVCWEEEELQALGALDELDDPISIPEFNELLGTTNVGLVSTRKTTAEAFAEVSLGDGLFFDLRIGKRVLKKDCVDTGIPCISANVQDVFGYIPESKLIHDFSVPSLTWGIDGVFDWHLIPAGFSFHPTDHCGVLRVVADDIDIEYLYHALRATRDRHGFDRTYRANLKNVARISVDIPIRADGTFDIEKQREIAATYWEIKKKREDAVAILRQIVDARVDFLGNSADSLD